MTYHCIMSVWGAEYTAFFLDAAIANQLQPGNLPALAGHARVDYVIHTTSADAATIRAHPALPLLARHAAVRLEVDDSVTLDNRYHALAAFHAKAVDEARRTGAALLFLAPDLFFPDETFRRVHALRSRGVRLALVPGPRGLKEALAGRFLEAGQALLRGEPRAVTAREMVRMLMDHPHRLLRQLQHDSDTFGVCPSHVYWRAGDEGFVLRAFHLHPLLFEPGGGPALVGRSVDGDLMDSLDLRDDEIHLARDSDELFAIDLTREADHDYQPPNRLDPYTLADWASRNATRRHQAFFRTPITLRAANPGPAWGQALAAADGLLEAFDRAMQGRNAAQPAAAQG